MTAFSAIVATRAPPASAKGGAGSDAPTALARASAAANGAATGGGGKQQGGREAELEELVTGLRRVTEKQKAEIDRLRKQQQPHGTAAPAGSSSGSSSGLTTAEAADPAKALRAAKAEAAHLHKRLAAAEEAARGADSVRRQLATAEAELRSLGAGAGGRGRPAAHGSLQAHSGSGSGGGPSDHGGADEPPAATAARLAAENEQLRAELAAFDLDFFGAWGGRTGASVPQKWIANRVPPHFDPSARTPLPMHCRGYVQVLKA